MQKAIAQGTIFLGTTGKQTELRSQLSWLKAEAARLTAESNNPGLVGHIGRHESERDLNLRKREIHRIEHVLRYFEIVEPATDTSVVGINSIVTYRRDEDDSTTCTVQVGEYGSTDSKANPPIISYDGNIILSSLFGRRNGESYDLELCNGKITDIKILDIRLPQANSGLKRVA